MKVNKATNNELCRAFFVYYLLEPKSIAEQEDCEKIFSFPTIMRPGSATLSSIGMTWLATYHIPEKQLKERGIAIQRYAIDNPSFRRFMINKWALWHSGCPHIADSLILAHHFACLTSAKYATREETMDTQMDVVIGAFILHMHNIEHIKDDYESALTHLDTHGLEISEEHTALLLMKE